ncbi:MAG: hypothetical protein HKN36_01150, partial [Hellea sp.]|nr:hypothetical protein [Hellea sp.]
MKFIITTGICLSLAACSGGTSPDAQTPDKPVKTAQNIQTAKTDSVTTPKFAKLGQGEIVNFPGHDVYHHVRAADLPSGVALTELTLAPKMLGAPPHIHDDEDEIFIVLSGK